MNSNRINLDAKKQHYIFLYLSVFFVLLSLGGIYMILDLTRPLYLSKNTEDSPEINLPPGSQIQSDPVTETAAESLSPTDGSPNPTAAKKPTITPRPTVTLKPSPLPTPLTHSYNNADDKFQVIHASNRTLYADREATGNRYTFYRTDGSIAVHVGSEWSWVHPGRDFSANYIVSGLNTFRYDISSQTIVDMEKNGLKYTVQCIHNGRSENKTECEQFLKDLHIL